MGKLLVTEFVSIDGGVRGSAGAETSRKPSLNLGRIASRLGTDMRAGTRFNHVSIHARTLEQSVRFYVDLFGMERLLPELERLADSVAQAGDALQATLYLEQAAEL